MSPPLDLSSTLPCISSLLRALRSWTHKTSTPVEVSSSRQTPPAERRWGPTDGGVTYGFSTFSPIFS